ncbi:MAG: ABC transporter substrate-binding protein [Bacteroidota bacterium]
MKNKRSLIHQMFSGVFLLLCTGAFMFHGCKQNAPVLRVATTVWPGYEILYLAKSLGYFDESAIRLIEVPSTSQVTRNLRNGTLEAGCMTLDESLTLLQDQVDLRVILVMDESSGGDVLMAKPDIENLQGLRGKRIGIENSTVSAVLLDAALLEAGLQAGDITQVPMSVDQDYQEYLAGRVDAVATYEPVRSQLLKEGAKILFSSKQIPGRIIDILVVRADVIDTYSNSLTALLNGYFKAFSYFEKHPTESAVLMKKRLGEDPLTQFDGLHIPNLAENNMYLSGGQPALYKSAGFIMDLMLKRKLLQKPCVYTKLADPRFLPVINN